LVCRIKCDSVRMRCISKLVKRFLLVVRTARAVLIIKLVSVFVGLIINSAVLAHGTDKHDDAGNASAAKPAPILAPGYAALTFTAPTPGSYTLAHVGQAAGGDIIDSSGEKLQLDELMSGRVSVLSFIYRACNDVNGCPLATFVMHQLRAHLEEHGGLSDRVRLISMSFDPVHDTADAMDAYKQSFEDSPIDWRFVTAPTLEALQPILDAYDQPLSKTALDDDSISINHMLRVFLVDANGVIRNVYSANLLHAETLFNDILTLDKESSNENGGTPVVAEYVERSSTERINIDYRSGYSEGDYASASTSLMQSAISVDLLALANDNALGLPDVPETTALTEEKIALGRQLFFERRLSINDTFSCAMCHIPQQAFTSNELTTSVGVEGRTVKRNAPTILNAGYAKRLFHDARESRLEQQIWAPLLANNEMANPSVGYVLDKITSIPEYADQFDAIYGQPVNMQSLGDALAAYQQVLVAGNAAFDRWFYGKQEDEISETAKLGYEVFSGKAGCSACHTINQQSALFSDYQLHNTGIGYAHSMSKPEPHELTLAPGVVVMVDPSSYAAASEAPPNDLGLYEVTLNPADRWKFKTPSLRNVALTAPYMHNGALATLEEVIDFYEQGGIANPELSALMRPLSLSEEEKSALVEFLHSLTGDSAVTLMNDGMAAPIGDPKHLQ